WPTATNKWGRSHPTPRSSSTSSCSRSPASSPGQIAFLIGSGTRAGKGSRRALFSQVLELPVLGHSKRRGTSVALSAAAGEAMSESQAEFAGRVLVVDDSRLVRAMIGRTLTGAGYTVAEAADGKVALALLSKEDFDVVITDLKMPELDGFGVLSAVKRIAPAV